METSHNEICVLEQGFPTPGPWTSTGPRPVRNRGAQQEVSGRLAIKALSAAPHRSHHPLNHPHPPQPWKNCLPRNWSLVPKRLGTAMTEDTCALLCLELTLCPSFLFDISTHFSDKLLKNNRSNVSLTLKWSISNKW